MFLITNGEQRLLEGAALGSGKKLGHFVSGGQVRFLSRYVLSFELRPVALHVIKVMGSPGARSAHKYPES